MSSWYRASTLNKKSPVFSGEGGLHTKGRWNHLGKPVIYCSDSISLCTLEWLAHHGLSVSAFDYYRFSITIPDNMIKQFNLVDLPDDWASTPASDSTRDFADQHLFNAARLAIAVPSVLIPEEYNLIINPLHSGFTEIKKTITALGRYKAPVRSTR